METILISVISGAIFAGLGLASMRAEQRRKRSLIQQSPEIEKNREISSVLGEVLVTAGKESGVAASYPATYNSSSSWQNRSGQHQAASVGTIGR